MADEEENSTSREKEIARLAKEQSFDRRGLTSSASPDDETARSAKSRRDRAREPYRKSRVRAPSGYERLSDGSVEPKGAPRYEVWVEKEADALVSVQVKAPPTRAIVPEDRWMIAVLSQLIEDASGTTYEIAEDHSAEANPGSRAPVTALDRLRSAYLAAFECPPAQEWQRRLRMYVEAALEGGRWRQDSPIRSGEMQVGHEILRVLQMQCPSVPQGLTAPKIEGLLRTTTLTRGGPGRKNRVRGADGITREARESSAQNYQNAIDELVNELGEPVWRVGHTRTT